MVLKVLSWFEKHNKISWLITLIGAGLIFYISSLTFDQAEYNFGILTIVYHFLSFFCFSFFLFISLVRGKKKSLFSLAIFISVFYAISDEIHQLYVPGRFCTVLDVLVDSAGILFSFMLYVILMKVREK
jgi:VanZ family protein